MAHKALINTYYLALDRKRLPTTAVKPHAGQHSEEKMSQIYLFSESRCYVCENQQRVHRRPKASGVLIFTDMTIVWHLLGHWKETEFCRGRTLGQSVEKVLWGEKRSYEGTFLSRVLINPTSTPLCSPPLSFSCLSFFLSF